MGSTAFLKNRDFHIFLKWHVEWYFFNWSLMQPTYFLFKFYEDQWGEKKKEIWQHSKWENCHNENNWRYGHDFNLSIQIWGHFILKLVKCWKHFNSASYFCYQKCCPSLLILSASCSVFQCYCELFPFGIQNTLFGVIFCSQLCMYWWRTRSVLPHLLC